MANEQQNAAPAVIDSPIDSSVPQVNQDQVHMAPQATQSQMVNVIDPDTQELGAIPSHQLGDALEQGFTQATPEQVDAHFKEQEFGTTGQKALTASESAAEGASFGLSGALENITGIPELSGERRLARKETNPISSTVGLIGGLTASSLIPGIGEANLLAKAGEGAAAAVGLATPVSTIAKIGSAAVKAATENMAVQGFDEVSKLIASDPNQSAQTALVDIGLSGLLGGGFGAGAGAVSPLWKTAMGGKVGGILKALTDRVGGSESLIPDSMNDTIQKSGLTIAPEVKAALSKDPEIQNLFKTLEQSDTTTSGQQLQEKFKDFKSQASDTMARHLGRDPSALPEDLSKAEAGKNIGNILAKEYHEQMDPIAKEYDKLRDKYGSTPLVSDTKTPVVGPEGVTETASPGTMTQIANKITDLADQQGWTTSPSSDIMKEVNRVLKELPLQRNVNDLSNYIKAVGDNMQSDPLNGSMRRAGGMIKGILKDAESDAIAKQIGEKQGAKALDAYQSVRNAYRAQSELKESLDSRLHAKGSTSGYSKSLKEMANTDGESLVRRLSGVNDADILKVLQTSFPKTAEALKEYHVDSILKNAMDKAKPGEKINSNAVLSSIGKMSPEMRDFAISKDALSKVSAIGQLLEHFNTMPHNFSNTARTMDKLMGHLPGSAIAVGAMIAGHNPALGLLMGPLVKYLGRDVPDATRLALLKFLGSNQPIEAEGFKSMVDFIHATAKGESVLSRASKAIFKAESDVLPEKLVPNERDRNKLDKTLKDLRIDQRPMLEVGGKAGHYLPDHTQALSQTAMNAVNYLNSQRPNTNVSAPLDVKHPPTAMQKTKFDRTLDIAQQPLLIFDSIKKGTLTSQDVTTVKALYPDLYARASTKLMEQVIDAQSKGHPVPYRTRLGLSLFLGQPMDSTMSPQGIMNAQPAPQQPQNAPQGGSKGSPNKLSKLSENYQTPGQAAEARRTKE